MKFNNESDGQAKEQRLNRAIAGVLAALLAVFVLYGLATGTTYGGRRGGTYLDRADEPVLFWSMMAIGAAATLYFSAAALGLVSTKIDRTDVADYRWRKQRDGTVFFLLMWPVLVYFWLSEVSRVGFLPSDAYVGLAFVGLLGFICLMAPSLPGRINTWVKLGGTIILSGAFIAMYFV